MSDVAASAGSPEHNGVTPRPAEILVPIDDLIIGRTVVRSSIDHAWARRLTSVEEAWPPILVTGDLQVLDGIHRVLAARGLHRDHIRATVHPGDGGDAELLETAAGCNAGHGLPLTPADRRSIVDRLLLLAPNWSDRRIAHAAGVSPTTVGNRRRRLASLSRGEKNDATRRGVQSGHLEGRIGRDGKVYPHRPQRSDAGRTTALSRATAALAGVFSALLRRLRSALWK